jgi:type II secretory pathway component PulC
LFPTVRVSGVTITNRVLAAVAMLILVAVFYSVAGAQRGIAEDVQKQIAGVGEMAVSPVTLPDVSVPAVDGLLEIVGRRNFFVPKLAEKDNSGAVVPVTAALTKDLKLVAISMDAAMASESMAIIKSKADSKTYFVKIGENVGDTEFVLTKVMADRIVLRQRKQEFELK